jgi:TatD DNase family protein
MNDLRLVDSHCHLNMPEVEADLPAMMQRAGEAGVRAIVVPGIDLASSRRAVELAESWPGVFAAVGVHPHHAGSWSAQVRSELQALASSARVVAIGETGLDFYRNLASREAQAESFRAQLDLAAELALPLIIHSRSATSEIFVELEAWMARSEHRTGRPVGVLHAFSGDPEHARRALGLGFLLGVAGPVTYPKADDLRTTLSGVPAECLVVETDAPYLAPVPHRGRRNEPAHVALVAGGLAAALALDVSAIASMTSGSAARLFGWTDDHTNRNLL